MNAVAAVVSLLVCAGVPRFPAMTNGMQLLLLDPPDCSSAGYKDTFILTICISDQIEGVRVHYAET